MLAGLLLAFSAQNAGSQITLNVNGTARTALVFAPSQHGAGRAPCVMVFHGYTANARLAAMQFEIHKLWPQAYVVYAQGLPTKLFRRGIGEQPGWQLMPGENGDRDVNYVKALLKWADSTHEINTKRIYYAGHSNGSGFAWVVLKTLGEKFAAFGALCGGTILPLEGAPKKPAILFAGSEDKLVPPVTVQNFAKRLARHNGCAAGRSSDGITVFQGPAPVYLCVYPGGHLPPKSAYKQLVEFFKSGKIKG